MRITATKVYGSNPLSCLKSDYFSLEKVDLLIEKIATEQDIEEAIFHMQQLQRELGDRKPSSISKETKSLG